MGLPQDLAFSEDGQSCVWWIAPHGIRADLRKTVPASVFFQADCQEEKDWAVE